LEFFKEIHENEMFLGNLLIIAVICKVDERFVETYHEGFLLINVCFDMNYAKVLEIGTSRRVKRKEFFGNRILICKNKANYIRMIGKNGDKLDKFFDRVVRRMDFIYILVIR
jgi:hypothetical protein